MTTINTKDFISYDRKALYEYLVLQQETEFEIKIPKISLALKHVYYFTYWEYHMMAYTGHLLNEIAASFAYFVPSVYKTQPFTFLAEIKDMDKFADILFNIIAACVEGDIDDIEDTEDTDDAEDELDAQIDAIWPFIMAADDFFKDAIKSEPEPATAGLICIANKYLKLKNRRSA